MLLRCQIWLVGGQCGFVFLCVCVVPVWVLMQVLLVCVIVWVCLLFVCVRVLCVWCVSVC